MFIGVPLFSIRCEVNVYTGRCGTGLPVYSKHKVMALNTVSSTLGRQKREPNFQAFVNLFDEKDGDITLKQQATNSTCSESSCLSENGWLVVSPTDPTLSLISNDVVSTDLGSRCSTMTDGGKHSLRCKRSLENVDQLCGYLNKYKVGGRNVTGEFKRRWFVHADNSCKLLYYRSPSDQLPLGEIDVASATLSFNALTGISSFIFEIRYEYGIKV